MSDEKTAPTPIEVRAPRGARSLEIDWSDGAHTFHRHAVLRGFCPCAQCQGHHGPVVWIEAPESSASLELESVEERGNYALQLGWGDGHATGIYTYRFLRKLAELADLELEEVKTMRIGR